MYLDDDENIWLKSLTDRITEAQFEKVLRERKSLSIKINALLYALALANPEVLEESYKKMGSTLEEVMDRIGFVHHAKLKEAEDKIAKLAVSALENAQAAKKADEEKALIAKKAEEEKALIAKKAEEEKALIARERMEAAVDMLRIGTPIVTIVKWTSLPEDDILKLKASID